MKAIYTCAQPKWHDYILCSAWSHLEMIDTQNYVTIICISWVKQFLEMIDERVIHPKTYLISHVFPETPLSLPHPNHTCCIRLKRLRCKNSNMVFDAVTMWQELSFFTKMEKSEPRTVSIYVSACESLVQNGSIRQIWFITTWSIFNELPNR